MEEQFLAALRDLESRKLDRRGFLKGLAAIAASAGVGMVSQGCVPVASTPGAKIGGALNLCVWQGYDDPQVAKPFLDKYGATTSGTYVAANEECMTKEKASPGTFDGIAINCTLAEPLYKAGLLQPVDEKVVTNWPDLMEGLRKQPYFWYENQSYFVPYLYGTICVNYNPKFVQLPDKFEFSDIFKDDRFKGKITFPDDPYGMGLLIGLINGHKDITRITKDQLQQNIDTGIQLKKRAVAIANSFNDATEMLVRGDAWLMLLGWEAISKWAADSKVTIDFRYPGHSWTWLDGWMVTKATKNPATAWAYINHMISPESQVMLCNNLVTAPANTKAYPLLKGPLAETFRLDKLEAAMVTAPVVPLPPLESSEFATLADWGVAWEKIKSA